jgi:predicted transcriptional regulator
MSDSATDAIDTRERVAAHVRSHPGVHFSELVRTLDLAPGQVQYHLRRLAASGRVVSEPLYGRTHYFPDEAATGTDGAYGPWERRALALLRRETARDVVAVVLDRGEVSPAAVAEDLAIARSTLEWHLDRLTDHGLVEKRRDERGRVTLVPARPEETVALVRAADPTLLGRMVDRFTRLVDRLLEGEG